MKNHLQKSEILIHFKNDLLFLGMEVEFHYNIGTAIITNMKNDRMTSSSIHQILIRIDDSSSYDIAEWFKKILS